jgi:hypothetical protein
MIIIIVTAVETSNLTEIKQRSDTNVTQLSSENSSCFRPGMHLLDSEVLQDCSQIMLRGACYFKLKWSEDKGHFELHIDRERCPKKAVLSC